MAKSKIIKDIANGTIDTITALKRAKVLTADLDNTEIMKWINYEIFGYPDGETLPEYRKVYGTLVGSYIKGSSISYMTWNGVSISLGDLDEDIKKEVLCIEFREGIEALRALVQEVQKGENEIAKVIPAECFNDIARLNHDPYMIISSAKVVIGSHNVNNIISTVENKLLDMLMILEKEFGCLDELDIDSTHKTEEKLQDINHQIIVLLYSDNHISIGDKNTIKGSEIISKKNKN